MRTALICFLLLVSAGKLLAPDPATVTDQAQLDAQADPIDITSLSTTGIEDPELAKVLRKYYQLQVGGWDAWLNTESMRLEGDLIMAEGFTLHFVAFKKKPNLCKIIITAENLRMVLSYDGEETWQIAIGEDMPEPMNKDEALNFIRDAVFVTHLVDPTIPGKKIELLGQENLVTRTYHHIRIRLASGEAVEHFLDTKTLEDRVHIVTDATTGDKETTVFGDYRSLGGIRVPFRAVKRVDGEVVSKLILQKAEVNIGLTPWFFSKPALLELEPADSTPADPDAALPMQLDEANNPFKDPLKLPPNT